MTAKPYPTYFPSGTSWLGEVPADWDVSPLGAHFRERKETVSDTDFPPLSVTMAGIVPQLETAAKTDNGDNRKRVEPNDFVINSRSDRKGSSGVSPLRGSVSVISIVLEPRGLDARYVHHLLRSQPFQEEFYRFGSGIVADLWSTRYSSMKQITLALPSAQEQRQIAHYLDGQTAKIDALIGKQEGLIGTLAERRQAVISHAVTKGLDVNAPMKNSGVELIGEIPAHWKALPLKRLISRIEQGTSPQASAELADDTSWGVVKSGCVNRGVFADEQHKRLPEDFPIDPSIAIRRGDLLVSRASGSPALVGSAAIVRQLRYQLILSDKTFRLAVLPGQNADFLEKVMNSRLFRDQVRGAISGAEGLANNLPSSSLKQFAFPAPPIEDQNAIVKHLDNETSKIDALSAKAREMINVLKERRQALISAAVTGKIDVRGLA